MSYYKAKVHQSRFRLPDHLASFHGATSKGRVGKGKGEGGGEERGARGGRRGGEGKGKEGKGDRRGEFAITSPVMREIDFYGNGSSDPPHAG